MVHLTKKSFYRFFLPKHHLIEHDLTDIHLAEMLFGRIIIKPNAVWAKDDFTERSFTEK
jgi:hypothetical protein